MQSGRFRVRYAYAYILWMDEQPLDEDASANDFFRFYLKDEAQKGYRRLPMVPEVGWATGSTATDVNGYPDIETVSWQAGLFCDATVSQVGTLIEIEVPRASPDNPAPLCILTDATKTQVATHCT